MEENKHSIVIIDDEESMRDSCRMILDKDGFLTETAEDGEKGLSKIKEMKPDIVLIDLKMPGIGGLDVLEKVNDISPDTIPIVITGYATVESAVEAMKKGAYDFLPKPFTPEQLRVIIKRGLEKIRLSREAEALRNEKKLIEENFITMVSHQLRSPLVAIAQYFEVMLSGSVGEMSKQHKDMLSKARNRVNSLLDLINDWLDAARIDKGQLVEKFKPVSLENLLKNQIEFLKPLAEKDDIQLEIETPDIESTIMGDKETLEQAFSNLLNNAIKYNKPNGSVKVSFRENNDNIITDIKDTGIGIKKKHIPHLFNQFYRVNRNQDKKGKGSGLGLSICKKIIEAHSGAIDVSSVPGEGTLFAVSLPKSKEKKTKSFS
ncbi:MAG: response regulator [Candidatus Aminicenantes bacterium]|nr:response regulator [Candidatus Aminicenantes bacterium]